MGLNGYILVWSIEPLRIANVPLYRSRLLKSTASTAAITASAPSTPPTIAAVLTVFGFVTVGVDDERETAETTTGGSDEREGAVGEFEGSNGVVRVVCRSMLVLLFTTAVTPLS